MYRSGVVITLIFLLATSVARKAVIVTSVEWQQLRRRLYRRRKGKCQGCGKQIRYADATLDHIRPKARGGKDHKSNVQILCKACNGLKADKSQRRFVADLEEKGIRW